MEGSEKRKHSFMIQLIQLIQLNPKRTRSEEKGITRELKKKIKKFQDKQWGWTMIGRCPGRVYFILFDFPIACYLSLSSSIIIIIGFYFFDSVHSFAAPPSLSHSLSSHPVCLLFSSFSSYSPSQVLS
ncbi:uncharacterized protein BDW47DRAFT_110282 [Aspergillus candidus]|uniref:Uncharacterized protein n=1 Tax=Aspergillus candidus TaxID=41067 RepID=A0A2I2F4J2_ASPCN|nr:hypothetical protein BDW47DRAFT_110282 [Aspergillus candidus]PLB35547.1 hypothetical protein BDW47DRAFT_110282 [Aspergillus candidus]